MIHRGDNSPRGLAPFRVTSLKKYVVYLIHKQTEVNRKVSFFIKKYKRFFFESYSRALKRLFYAVET